MSTKRTGAPGVFRRWYAGRKAERRALSEYKCALRTLTRLHSDRDRAVAAEHLPSTIH